MPLIGTFETMPIPELLQWIGQGRKTGTLQVTTDKGLAVLAFEEGELIFSASSDQGQTLSKLLMEAGVLTDEVHQQARAVCRKTGIGLGKALTDLNVLRESELLALMRRKVENELLGLLQTEEGRFQFIDDDLPDLELLPMRVDVTKTLLRVTQRMDEGEGFDHTDPDA
ncbi:MAG: DUF4388 domain-containing protein [Thermoanaerobaculia bacterium]|nr:DUF4388 domain-containing protein [Thermoanaerobaculia bacterium]